MVDLYQYNYVEYDGFQSVTYAIQLLANTITIKSGKGVGKYEFRYDGKKKRLSLYGDDSILCDIDDFLAVSSIDKISIADTENGDRVIRLSLTLIDGTKEVIDFPLSELIELYKGGQGIEITSGGTININVKDGGLIKFDNDEMYVDIKGGEGISVDEDGFISYTGSTASSGYTIDEVDEIIDGVYDTIYGLSGETENMVDDLENEIASIVSGMTDLGDAIDELSETLDGVISGLTESGETIEWLVEKVNEHSELISGLTESASTALDMIDVINDGLAVTGETIDGIIEDIEDLDERVSGNTADIDRLKSFSGETVSALSDLSSLIEEVSGDTLDAAKKYTDDEIHELRDEFAINYTLQSRTDQIKEETDALISSTSGETLTYANDYTDGKLEEVYEKMDEYVKTDYATETYARKTDVLRGMSEAVIEAKSYTDEIKTEVDTEITEHTTAMKQEIADEYLKQTDAEGKYLTITGASEIYETKAEHAESFTGFTSIEKHEELKSEVSGNTCDINHIYELIGANKETVPGTEYVLVQRSEFEALVRRVEVLESK